MDCDSIVRDETAERYLLGRLSEAEQAAYEQHYFECARCFAELSRLQAVREVLREHPPLPDTTATARRPRVNRTWAWPVVAALAATVTGAVVLLRQGEGPERTAQSPVVAPTAIPEAAPPGRVAATPVPVPVDGAGVPAAIKVPEPSVHVKTVLARLAHVDPPHYSPRVLRGAVDEATVSFQEGMKAYVAGDYRAAVPRLSKAASLDPERPDMAFFLAASELLAGNPSDAIREFERTIAMGDTPFLEEAHFFLAKAHLARGDVDRARAELTTVRSLEGERLSEAGELLTQMDSAGSD